MRNTNITLSGIYMYFINHVNEYWTGDTHDNLYQQRYRPSDNNKRTLYITHNTLF